MGIVKEFKDFAVKGNVVDMAVGIIIGGAFGKIVTSFVNDVLMPPIGKLMGGVDFKAFFFSLSEASFATLAEAEKAGAPVLKYGVFIQTVIDFLIMAFSIFMMIRVLNRLKRKEDAAPVPPAAPPKQEVLLEEIRDLMKAGRANGV
jgi:large conductance mechanosensitive channel